MWPLINQLCCSGRPQIWEYRCSKNYTWWVKRIRREYKIGCIFEDPWKMKYDQNTLYKILRGLIKRSRNIYTAPSQIYNIWLTFPCKKLLICQVVVAHEFNPSTQEAKAGGSLWIWGQPVLQTDSSRQSGLLHREILPWKTKPNKQKEWLD